LGSNAYDGLYPFRVHLRCGGDRHVGDVAAQLELTILNRIR
jgi:hypothetical protein